METKKILLTLSFFTAIFLANVSGPQYVFPTFGPSLATRFHWSSMENSVVGTAVFVGVSFSGPLCAWLVEHLGFRKTLTMSAIVSFLGVFLLAETYVGYLSDNYILCSLYLIFIGAASSASYLCALDSQAYNFKSYRGMSLGLTSASLGISGLVFSQINDKFFKSNSEELEQDSSTFRFLLFFGCTTACITLFASFILGPIHHPKLPSIKQPILNKDTENYAATTNGLYRISSCSTQHEEESSDTDVFFENDTISSSVQIEDEDEINQSGLAVLLDPVGSSLFLSLLVILGFGYVYLTNIETLLISLSKNTMTLSETQHLRNLHISTFSVSNCMTRAVFGTLSDILQRRTGMHRLWFIWFGALGLLLSVTPLIMSVSNADDLLSYSLLIAIPYGIAFGIAPAIISEFGTKTFAKNWGWCMCAPAIGSQLFNLLFGFVYAKELKRQGGEICYGIDCFKTTFVIGAVSACTCVVVLSASIYRKALYTVYLKDY